MVQCYKRLNAIFQQSINDIRVEFDAFVVYAARFSIGQDTAPADAKPVSRQPEFAHELYIFSPSMKMVACYLSRGSVAVIG